MGRGSMSFLHHIIAEDRRLSELARIPTVMTFGKHKGTPIKDVPADYKRWLLGQADIDPYLQKALRGEAA